MPTTAPAAWIAAGRSPWIEAGGDGHQHAQRADRRHDADRAERHRPVEGAQGEHHGGARSDGDRGIAPAQRVAAGSHREHQRQDEPHRLADEQHGEGGDPPALQAPEEVGDPPGDARAEPERYAEHCPSPNRPSRLNRAATVTVPGLRTATSVHSPSRSTHASPEVTVQ